jgi:uncharacterized protein (DUF2164 family)
MRFTRKSITDSCPLCQKKVGDKEYLSGQLIHLAFTRVPVNTRTEVEVEKAAMTTKKEDAASIVGEELAEELDQKAKLVGKSEAYVERSDDEEVEVQEQEEAAVEKAEVVEKVVKSMDDEATISGLPFGGAITFEEVDALKDAQAEMMKMYDNWYTLSAVIGNIFQNDGCKDKKKAVLEALSGCKKRLETKALIVLANLETPPVVELSEIKPHPLDEAISTLKASFDVQVNVQADVQQKLQAVQESFNGLGNTVKSLIEASAKPQETVTEVVKSQVDVTEITRAFTDAIAPLLGEIKLLNNQLSAKESVNASRSATPQRRSFVPDMNLMQKSQVEDNSIRSIARRSVGLPS